MLKKILIGTAAVVAILVVGFLIVVSMQPDDFRISRSAKMSAPPSAVFTQVNDYHQWDAWSPWAKLDPNAKVTYEGPTSGEGAIFAWSGNDEVGVGRQTIVESRPDELVRIKLEFEKPFKATSTAEFTFKPEGDQTLVTWSMFGKNSFMCKAISLLMDCDKMVGSEFEKGLASMKAVVEAPTQETDEGKKPSEQAVTKAE
jgi:polyketide cyclase/dehydrase/lipid transport protein